MIWFINACRINEMVKRRRKRAGVSKKRVLRLRLPRGVRRTQLGGVFVASPKIRRRRRGRRRRRRRHH